MVLILNQVNVSKSIEQSEDKIFQFKYFDCWGQLSFGSFNLPFISDPKIQPLELISNLVWIESWFYNEKLNIINRPI